MLDYSQYKTEELMEMLNTAFSDYYEKATKPCGNGNEFLTSPEAKALEQSTEQYEAICKELVKRGVAKYT